MDIKDAATYLLILRIISTVALGWVLWKQIRYLRINQPPEEQIIRFALTMVTLILMAANVVPIVLDVLTIFKDLPRSTNTLNNVGIAYTFSNAGFAAAAGLGWAFFYWLAERERVHLRKDITELNKEVDTLHQEAADVKEKQDKKDARQTQRPKKQS